jgi:hypothetical protein
MPTLIAHPDKRALEAGLVPLTDLLHGADSSTTTIRATPH